MVTPPLSTKASLLAAVSLLLAAPLQADDHVLLNARANEEYVRSKSPDGKPKPESYVVMTGNFFGGATVDRTLERIPFRRIVTMLAPELAKREYWPAKSPNQADLLLVVHWGVTTPRTSVQEMMGRTELSLDVSNTRESMSVGMDVGERLGGAASVLWDVGARGATNSLYAEDILQQQIGQMDAEMSKSDSVRLLGYGSSVHKFNQSLMPSVNEIAAIYSLNEERYFIIVMAYDLHTWQKGKTNRAIWSIRLNISSAGNNFETAVARMSKAAAEWAGRNADDLQSVRTKNYKGSVNIAPLIILGETK